MKNKLIFILILVILTGCGSQYSSPEIMYENTKSDMGATEEYYVENEVMETSDLVAGYGGPLSNTTDTQPMIVKNASLSVQSENQQIFDTALKDAINTNEGYITRENIFTSKITTGEYIIKVPSKNFDNLLEAIDKIGIVTDSTISSEDISSDYINTTTFIEIKKIEEERLLAIREQATVIEDIIALEEKLTEVRTEISIKTELANSMLNQTKYSEIIVNYRDKNTYSVNPFEPKFFQQLKDAFVTSFSSLQYILIFIAYIILPVSIIGIFILITYLFIKKSKKQNK